MLTFDITIFNQEGKEIFEYKDVQNLGSNGKQVPDISFYIRKEGDVEDRYSEYVSYTGFPYKVTHNWKDGNNRSNTSDRA